MSRFGFLFLFAALGLYAQVNTGSISGYVLDPSAGAIPNAGVTLEDTARSLTRTMQTSATGFYEFDGASTRLNTAFR